MILYIKKFSRASKIRTAPTPDLAQIFNHFDILTKDIKHFKFKYHVSGLFQKRSHQKIAYVIYFFI